MELNESILFHGGMNTDDDPRYLPEGDYLEAYYLRGQGFVGGTGNVLTNLPGDVLKTNGSLPAGTNTVIGACPLYDDGTFQNGIVYFVHNTTPANHTIWYYNIVSGAFQLVIQSSVLNFQLTNKIIQAFVLDGKLYWTDGYFSSYAQVSSSVFGFNPPRMLNLANAIAGYSNVTMQTFDVIKWPPRFAPTVAYTDNPDGSLNLYGKLFQFRYKYIYENNEESCWSPISDLPLPNNGYWMSGDNTRDIQDNEIDVTYNTGHETVKKIVHAFRLGNAGEFSEWRTIDKAQAGLANNVNDTISFFNNTFGPASPFNAPNFHTVPQVAGCQELLTGRGGELCYADIRESFDPVSLNIGLDFNIKPVLYQRNASYSAGKVAFNTLSTGPDTWETTFFFIRPSEVYGFQVGDTFVFTFEVTDPLGPLPVGLYTYYYDVTALDTDADTLMTNIAAYFTSLGFTASVDLALKRLTIDFKYVNAVGNNGQTIIVKNVLPIRTWKTGTTHKIGLKYENRANQEGAVQYVPLGELKIPSYSQNDTSTFSNVRLPYEVIPELTINHTPPIWATHYRVCTQYSTTIESFGWYPVAYTQTVPGNTVRLRITLDGFYRNQYGVNNVHQINVGDKVRFIRRGADFDATFDNQPPYVDPGGDIVMTILNYVPGGNNQQDYIEVDFIDLYQYGSFDPNYLTPNTVPIIQGSIVEIFSEKPTTERDVWFETPASFSIANAHTANRAHVGSFLSGLVVSMNAGTQNIVVEGDLSGVVGYTLGITGNTNAGLYPVLTAVYDDTTNQTTLTSSLPFVNTVLGGAYTITLQQTSTLPAVVFLGGDQGCGDIYLRQRHHNTGLNGANLPVTNEAAKEFYAPWVEDPAYSDYFGSSVYSQGRIAIENPFEKGKRLRSAVVHGKAYIFESQVNNICVFEFQDREQLNDTYGAVRRLVMVGDTLQCLQERKNTSIYIQKTIAVDPDGAVSYGASDKTFGGKRERGEEFGVRHGESVVKTDEGVFYYDYYNGKFVVSTNNGQVSVSDGKFKFNSASAQITSDFTNSSPLAYCLGYHDMENNEVGWFFNKPVVGEEPAYTLGVVFNYEQQRWKYYMTHNPTWVMNNGEFLCEWSGAQMYIMNQPLNGTTPNYSTFLGSVRRPSVSFVSKFEPERIKKWHQIAVKTQGNTNLWSLDEVVIPENLSYSEMESRILSNSFSIKEGYQSANYKRDLNSPNYASAALALINGRELRGVYARHLLTLTGENKKTTLFGCAIKGVLSEAQ
jgi:hypothetical protein